MDDFVYKSSPHSIERSLLQKAVRRGEADLTERVVTYLINVGDENWLKNRLYVIAYEECWPIANQIQAINLITEYKQIACTIKNKNAWALAKLAASFKNSYFLDSTQPDDINDEIVYLSKVLKDPEKFWEEIKDFSGYDGERVRIESAQKALPKAKFPDDKAMMYAAARLAIKEKVPEVETIQPITTPNFPYWVAFDKHTEDGKWILQLVAERLNMNAHAVGRMTFYFAGVVCNNVTNSPFYDLLVQWRYKQMEREDKDYLKKWNDVEALIIELTKDDVEKLKTRINNTKPIRANDQGSLFD